MKRLGFTKNEFTNIIRHFFKWDRIEWTKDVDETLSKRPFHYIVMLLEFYDGVREKDGIQIKSRGLRAKHFRYALIDNKDESLDYTKDLELLFKGDLSYFKKGHINSRTSLNYYLKTLMDKGIIKRITRKKPHRYILTQKYHVYRYRKKIDMMVNLWDDNMFLHIDTFFDYLGLTTKDNHLSEGFICGLDDEILSNLNYDKRKELRENIQNIEKNIKNMLDIKIASSKKPSTKSMRIGSKKISFGQGYDKSKSISLFIDAYK